VSAGPEAAAACRDSGRRDASPYTVKRPILKSSLMRQIVPLEYTNTLLKRSIPKKPR
jgi:hypothetical protein